MRKKQQAVYVLAFVFVLLCICAAALALYTPRTAVQPQDTTVYSIHEIPVSQVKAVAVTNDRATFGVMMVDQEVAMVSDVEGNYSASELRAFLYAASHITGSRENKDLAAAVEYGVETPQARVTLIQEDGEEVNFSILRQNPIDGSYYLFSENNQATYLIPAFQAELFLRREEDFFVRTVLPVIGSENYKEVQSVRMEFGGNGRDYTIRQQGDGFYLTEPILQRVPAPVVMEELLRYLSALYADHFVEAGVELSDYGFDAYTLKVTVQLAGETYTALLLEQEGEAILMANPADNSVYELQTPYLPMLLRDYLTLTRGRAYTYAAGDLRSILISDSQREILYEVSGIGEQMQVLVNGETLDGPEFAGIVDALNSAVIDKEVEEFPDDPDLAELRIIFTLNTGSIEVVEFLPDQGDTFFVSVNGIINFTTTRAAVQGIAEAAFRYH